MGERKTCTKCGRLLPVQAFNRSSKNPDGYQTWCYGCQRNAGRPRKEIHLARSRRTRARRYRQEPAYRQAALERRRQQYRQNPEKFKEEARARRAKIRAVRMEEISFAEVARRCRFHCGLCGDLVDMDLKRPDPMSPSLDHVVPLVQGGAHSYANVQLAHLRCNLRKGPRLGGRQHS